MHETAKRGRHDTMRNRPLSRSSERGGSGLRMQPKKEHEMSMIGKHCVVRTYSAGVHIGTVTRHEGTEVELANARRLWKWEGAFTLSEVATVGIKSKGSRMSIAVPEILLTQAVEIIPTTEKAQESYDATHE